jgi:signal transduction histidine kinase
MKHLASPGKAAIPPVAETLRRVVVMFRLLGWVWMLLLVITEMIKTPEMNRPLAIAISVLATVWAGLTVLGSRNDWFLGKPWFIATDLLMVGLFLASGWLTNAGDFIAGGYPMSFLFVLAYGANFRWTVSVAVVFTCYFALLHNLMNLGLVRTVGSIQFLVFGVIAGWAFDALRERESLRLQAEAELRVEQQAAAVHDERARMASQLHDSVLQTLHAIRIGADDADEVRYLVRRQERELRRVIDEFISPYAQSFRVELLTARDLVEDLHRVEVQTVIRDDAALTPALVAAAAAAKEAMTNAAKHSGAHEIHLYSEIGDSIARINVRDRGSGFVYGGVVSGRAGIPHSLIDRVTRVGGTVAIDTLPDQGTDVTICVPWP